MNILEREGISPTVLGLLQFIRLNTGSEYIHGIIRQYLYDFETESGRKPLEILDEAGYIKYTKTGAKSRPWENIRLSELGEKILKEMNQKSQHELSEYMLDYTTQQYQRIGADKSYLKSGGKILHYISEFLNSRPSEYTERMIRAVIMAYVESFDHDYKYLNKMSTLFFKPANVYNTKFNVDESPLHNFINMNKDKVKYYYTKV